MSGEPRVLHVDDDPGFRDLTVAQLESRGFTVDVAPDAESGLDRLASGSFDCVVSDYEMPGLDGLAFLERVRERWDLPFVLFTGAGDESVAGRALAAGATGYVRKHDDGAFDELADRVRRSVASWRATRDLRERARHYRLVAEHLPNAVVFLFDREFRYRFAAGEGLAGLGLSPDDVEGRTLADVASTPGQYEFIAERYRRVLDGEEVRIEHRVNGREFETRLVPVAGARTLDGPRDGPGPPDDATGAGSSEDPTAAGPSDDATDVGAPIEVDAAVDVDDRTRRTSDDGAGRTASTSGATKIQYGLGIGTDVTERNERERELRRYEAIVENMHEGAFVVDRELRLRYANPSSLYWADVDPETVYGENVVTLAERMVAPGEPIEAFERALRAALERPPPEAPFPFADDWPEPITLELDLPRGRPIIEYHVAALNDYRRGRTNERGASARDERSDDEPSGDERSGDERRVDGLVVIGRDVTAQRRRERALEDQAERLGRFASVASHDLRNPLSAARGWLGMGQSAIDDGDDPTAALERTERALERTERILDDVRALAEGSAPVDAERVDSVGLADVATEVWTDVEADGASLQVETDAVVRADPVRLRRFLENLLRNAVDHGTPIGDDGVEGSDDGRNDGDGVVTVTLGELPDGGFYVGDDGPGIPDADRETVFEHGYTTRAGGTGHGLAIVAEIAATHGWSVVATEGTDGGARIEVRDVEFVARDGRE